MATCKFCQQPIRWKYPYGEVPNGAKNTPLNLDGSVHDCRDRAPVITPETANRLLELLDKLDEHDVVLNRIEVKIDKILEKVRAKK